MEWVLCLGFPWKSGIAFKFAIVWSSLNTRAIALYVPQRIKLIDYSQFMIY